MDNMIIDWVKAMWNKPLPANDNRGKK